MTEERKLATILFADLAGSTALADEDDPERTRARLERFYDAMAAEIQGAGGTVEKFAGDAVMAAFGAPDALEDHAERALHTALAMQRRLDPGLSLRIGVNTGQVVAGVARAQSSFVSGDAVNVAARLEQAAEPGEILVGERTAAAARGAFEFGDARTVEAKGKPGGVACRPLVRALSLTRKRGVGGLADVFVGRDAELERLVQAHRRSAERGRPVLVTVLGDPGVGKSRLLRELWERVAGSTRLVGRCLAYGEGITFWPLAEILKAHLELLESDPPDEVRRRLGSREILGLTLGLDVAGELHPLAARDRLQAAWVELVSELAAERPVVLLVEDVHWAEQPLLDVLERLLRDVPGPLLVLVTARPDFSPAWDPRLDSETLLLEPLGADAAASLVDALLAADLPPAVRELVVRRAEGNPFFVEEVLGSLIDAGVLIHDDGGWRVGELPEGFELPDSVQAVLAARIDLLGEAEKAALQSAAVIGRVFWTGPVYELVEGHEPDLGVLEGRDFVRRRSGSSLEGEVEYVFKHALTREVAYGGLTKARRARLHAAFGEWLERVGGGRDEHAPLLAHHYAEAVRPEDVDVVWPGEEAELASLREKALQWLSRAADAAISRYEIDDALALLHRATGIESDAIRLARLWRRVGRAYALKYDGESFMAAMQRALEACDEPRERAEAYADLAFEGSLRSGMWRRRPGREEMDDWTSRALAGVEHGTVAHVKALISRAFWGLSGEDDGALAERLANELGEVGLVSAALDARGVISFREGNFEQAYEWESRRFDLLPQMSDPDLVHDLYLSTIPTAAAMGRLVEARRLAQELKAVVADLTTHHRVHGVGVVLEVEELMGDWAAVRMLSDEVQAVVGENRDTPCVRNARSLLICALAHELAGESELSRELEQRADDLQNEGYGAVLSTPRARLAMARGEPHLLEELLADENWLTRQTWFALPSAATRLDALAVIGGRDEVEAAARELAPPGSYVEPFAVRALGIVRGDEALLRRADDRFGALGLPWHAGQTETLRRLRRAVA